MGDCLSVSQRSFSCTHGQASDVSIPHWVHPSGNKAFSLLRLSPEFEIVVSAKARFHRGKPGGVACLSTS